MPRGTIVKDPDNTILVSICFNISICRSMKNLRLYELGSKEKEWDNLYHIIPREFPPENYFRYDDINAKESIGTGQQVEFDLVRCWFFWKRAKVKWIICDSKE